MGAVYGKGYIDALIAYLESVGINSSIIVFEADFAPFQTKSQCAVGGIMTLQFSHSGDGWAGDAKIPGAIKMDTSWDEKQVHSLETFLRRVPNLPSGEYRYDLQTGEIINYDKNKFQSNSCNECHSWNMAPIYAFDHSCYCRIIRCG